MSNKKIMRTVSAVQSVLLSLAASAVLFLAVDAHATMTEIQGGPGGGAFTLACPDGEVLVGFRARAGAWVDAIGLVCSAYSPATKKVSSNLKRHGFAGGTGGGPQEAYCESNQAVTGIALAHTRGNGLPRQYINTVGMLCNHQITVDRCISSGEGCGPIAPTMRGTLVKTSHDYQYDVINCPASEIATGIQGRSGSYVDAIGLICARPPTASHRPAATPPGGPAMRLPR
jgi:hypothetical protein